jgi:hypothetical protein
VAELPCVWDSRFAEPVVLEDGGELATLRDAIRHLAQITPKAEHDMEDVLTASYLLTQAAEHGGPLEFARIATLRAINRHDERVVEPSRREPHWGRRKLARPMTDQDLITRYANSYR